MPREYVDDCKVLAGKMSCSTGNVSSPPQRTKQVGFVGGYVHSVPRRLHLRQRGISFPHLRFAVAQASHAFVSRVVAMFVGGGFYSLWRKIEQLLARLLRLAYPDCICKLPPLGGNYPLWDSHRPALLNWIFQIYLLGTQRTYFSTSHISPCVPCGISGSYSTCKRPGSAKNSYQIIRSRRGSLYEY
jgi:hypothetical protein